MVETPTGQISNLSGGSASQESPIEKLIEQPTSIMGNVSYQREGSASASTSLMNRANTFAISNYYGQFIRAAQEGGMAAVCATEQWRERIAANPHNGEYLRSLPTEKFIAVVTRWKEIFEGGRTCL